MRKCQENGFQTSSKWSSTLGHGNNGKTNTNTEAQTNLLTVPVAKLKPLLVWMFGFAVATQPANQNPGKTFISASQSSQWLLTLAPDQ